MTSQNSPKLQRNNSDKNKEKASDPPVVWNGVDVVGIPRVAQLLDEFGQSFRDRIFTTVEQTYCDKRPDPAQHYAARWAVKEAFFKAIEIEEMSLPFNEVGIERTPNGPVLNLSPKAELVLSRMSQREGTVSRRMSTSVSIAHDQPSGVAIAHVIIAVRCPESNIDRFRSTSSKGDV